MLATAFGRVAGVSAMDIFFYILLSAGVVPVIANSCEKYEGCLTQLEKFADRQSLVFGKSSSQLQIECAQALASVTCLTAYPSKCLTGEGKKAFENNFSGLKQVTWGICLEESKFRQQYLKALPCLSNITNDAAYCHEKYERNSNDIDDVQYEDKQHLRCCSFDGYRRCLRMLAETQGDCAEMVAEVLDGIALQRTGNFVRNTCADQFDRCRGSAYQTLGSTFLTLLAALCTIFVSTIRVFY